MATLRWRGDVPAVSQTNTVTVGGTAANGQIYSVTINTHVVSYTATGIDTNTTIAAALQALLAASTIAEFQEVTWTVLTTVITGVATLAGRPFTNTSAATGTGTLVTAITIASSGPNDVSIAGNWSTGSLPANGDTVFVQNSNSDLLYGLSSLSAVSLASLIIDASFTATVGLPYTNASGGYVEYRARYWQIQSALVSIGYGPGSASGRIMHDAGSATACTWTVFNTGQTVEQNLPSLILKGTNAGNILFALKGSIGVAIFASETSTLATLDCGFTSNQSGDVTILCGSGLTLTTLNQTGGAITLNAGLTTLSTIGGKITIWAGNITTLTNEGATVVYNDSGTITTANVSKTGVMDLSQAQPNLTITNCTLNAGATWLDPNRRGTYSNGVILNLCSLTDVTLNLGNNEKLSVVYL